MKKVISVLLAAVLTAALLAGCSSNSGTSATTEVQTEAEKVPETEAATVAEAEVEPAHFNVSALKGPTAMGMVKLMDDAENGETFNDYDFTLATTDEIVPLLTKGDLDIAALPANLASVLYNNTDGAIQVMAINTLGVLYVVEKGDTIQSVEDLKGKTIYSTGKGSTPEFAINYVLSENGIDPEADVTIEFKSEAAEILPLLKQADEGIAIIPQPFVTNALANVEGLRIALDWTVEWDKASTDGSSLITGVIVVRKEIAEAYPEALAIFCEEYAASTRFTQTNLEEAAALVGKYEIVTAEIAQSAMPYCNITYIDGAQMQAALEGYLSVLYEQNPTAVGGELPDEGFYYIP